MAKSPAAASRETKAQILERAEREKVKFMRLQFTDILGTIKNVEIPDRQFEEALDGKIMFDGSSIEGSCASKSRTCTCGPTSRPSASSRGRHHRREGGADDLRHLHARRSAVHRRPARLPEESDRAWAAAKGYSLNAGPEASSSSSRQRRRRRRPRPHDAASYFDLSPVDMGEDVRREIVLALEAMGFHVEGRATTRSRPGQHEIDFRYDDVLTTADNISTFRFVVKNIAIRTDCTRRSCPNRSTDQRIGHAHHMSLFNGRHEHLLRREGAVPAEQTCLNYIGGIPPARERVSARSPIRW
jgi:glutamine synthetase